MPIPNPMNKLTLNPIMQGTLVYEGRTIHKEVYILHPGDCFPQFGGSSAGLVVRKTPSLIIRTVTADGQSDYESDTHNKDAWNAILEFMQACAK